MARLYEKIFRPNLLAAIKQELSRLNQLEEKLNETKMESPVEDFRRLIQDDIMV